MYRYHVRVPVLFVKAFVSNEPVWYPVLYGINLSPRDCSFPVVPLCLGFITRYSILFLRYTWPLTMGRGSLRGAEDEHDQVSCAFFSYPTS
jgi:hypothetical protein